MQSFFQQSNAGPGGFNTSDRPLDELSVSKLYDLVQKNCARVFMLVFIWAHILNAMLTRYNGRCNALVY